MDYLNQVAFTKVKTGINAGVYTGGNKGALLVRMQVRKKKTVERTTVNCHTIQLYNSWLAFVCAHFAAHQNQIEQRNGDMRDIYSKGKEY